MIGLMKHNPEFQSYFLRSQRFSFSAMEKIKDRTALLELIEGARSQHPEYDQFLLGERAFYAGNYSVALKHYLQVTKELPYYKLFCYRASAYASQEAGDPSKAQEFVQKALGIYSEDYPSLLLLDKLLQNSQCEECSFESYFLKVLEDQRQLIDALTLEDSVMFSQPDSFIHLDHGGHPFTYQLMNRLYKRKKYEELFKKVPIRASLRDYQDKSLTISPLPESPSMKQINSIIQPSLGSKIMAHNRQIASNKSILESKTLPIKKAAEKPPIIPRPAIAPVKANAPALPIKSAVAPSKPLISQTPLPVKAPMKTAPTSPLISNTQVAPVNALPRTDEKKPMFTEEMLVESISTFQQHQQEAIADYRTSFLSRIQPFDSTLYALHGWIPEFYNDQSLSLTNRSRSTTGGYFIRWNGKGIVINPGRNFLDNFHKQGLHIWDINAIIVTCEHYDSYADIQEIYSLNSKLNKDSSETHVIHYYLVQKAYQLLAPHLKPHFKQERHSLHCLELFIDSPEQEKIEINENVILSYFPLSEPESNYSSKETKALPVYGSLGIKLEFIDDTNGKQDCKLGYISNTIWNSVISQRLGDCDLLISGFGSTQPSDYQRQQYTEGCLGYFGTSSLLAEARPRLLLCSEFSGTEGDIRLEIVKLLRQQHSQSQGAHQAIQPLDLGMLVNLKKLQIQCSITKAWVEANQIRVARTRESFGSLNYLSPNCWS